MALRMKPTFLIIGAAKAATTTLWHLLRQHPEVFMSSRKETHFFSFDSQYERGIEWYESWFADAEPSQQRGEASASYATRRFFPDAAARIAAYEPNLRLIYIVRHPLERIESLWVQLRQVSVTKFVDPPEGMRVDLDFDRALREQADALIESTKYWEEISQFRKHFPDEQILVLLSEDLRRDPQAVLRRCFEFLGIDPEFEPESPTAQLNTMSQQRLPRTWIWKIWGSPHGRKLYIALADLFPNRVRKWIGRHLLRGEAVERPEWNPETRDRVRRELEDDTARFLEFYGFPADTWDLGS